MKFGLVIVGAAGLVFGLVAGAPPALATGPSITLTPLQGPPGTSAVVTGRGFCSAGCSAVTVDVNGVPQAQGVAVSPQGTFTVSVAMSGGSGSGSIPVVATQQQNAATVQVTTYFAVTPSVATPGAAPPTSSPVTTSPSTPAKPPGTTTTAPSGIGGGTGTSTTQTTVTPGESAPTDPHGGGPSGSGWSPLTVLLVCVAALAAVVLSVLGYRRLRAQRR